MSEKKQLMKLMLKKKPKQNLPLGTKTSWSVVMQDDSAQHTWISSRRFSDLSDSLRWNPLCDARSKREVLFQRLPEGKPHQPKQKSDWGARWRMESWSKRITAITFGNGRKLISPHRDASPNTLFTISLGTICSRLCCEAPLNQSGRGGGVGRRNVSFRGPAELFLLCVNRAPRRPHVPNLHLGANVSALRTFSRRSRWERSRTVCWRDPSLCFHIDIKPSIRGLLSSSWQRLGCRLWHTFNH